MTAQMTYPKARLLRSCSRLYWWGQKNHLGRAMCWLTPGGKQLTFREAPKFSED